MSFVILKDEDGEDFICNSANIASITAQGGDVVIAVHKGATVKGDRSLRSSIQEIFRLNAERRDPAGAALKLADDIAAADSKGVNLDLRKRCPPPRKKEPYDPAAGW
ncbi:MAG: hypothetical protein GC185_07185 [Alphaproteobacteria bacterium]|nr:hypothetical protein [Alphaproteobacteria bacterium]